MTRRRPRRPLLLGLLATALAALMPVAPAAADCPGGAPVCPYADALAIGQRGGGVLRFPQTVAVGPDGNVYVGDQWSHVVQVFTRDGQFVREVGQAGIRAGEFGAIGAVAVAPDNTLLVADGSDRIDHFDPSGNLLSSWGSTGSAVGQFHFGQGGGHEAPAGGGLAVSGSTVFVADSFNDRIQRFSLDGGNGAVIVPPGTVANPRGMAVRGSRLIVADDHHHRLAVFDTGGHLLKTVAQQGVGPGQLRNPFGVAIDPRGRVFVADDLNHRVVRFSTPPNYPYKGRWGAYGTGPGQLAYPRGIAADAQGDIYVANTGNDRIDVFDLSGTLLRSFGRSGRGPDQFDNPLGVAADASGIRAVADSINGRVQLLNRDGSLAASWGSPNPGPTILPEPVGVAFDGQGNAFVLDQQRGRVVEFGRGSGMPVRTIGIRGSGPGQLLEPTALALDGGGTIYVADAGNERIARFSATGDYLGAIPGTGVLRGIAVTRDGGRIYAADAASWVTVYDPNGEELARFGGKGQKLGKIGVPGQIALDPDGNLWVADRGNNRVEEFGPNGERLQTLGQRGTATGQFLRPTGVTVDCNGVLTVTDTGNNRVQQFTLAARPANAACAPLPPLGTPPPPQLPTLPTPVGPQVTLKLLRTQSVSAPRGIPVLAGCDTVCRLQVSGTVTQAGRPKHGRRRVSVALSPATATLGAAQTQVLRLKLSRASARKLRLAMGSLRGVTIQLQATADSTTAEGSSTTVTTERRGTR